MTNRKLWTTRDGTKVRIKDMTNSHLVNTINLLRRVANKEASTLTFPMFSGEEAQRCAENDYDMIMEDPTVLLLDTLYEDLVEEAFRRKLEKELK